MAKLYKIRNWSEIYEVNRTRELKNLTWVPLPIKLDGDGYCMLMEKDNTAGLFGAWTACLEVAARCNPRGTFIRSNGIPHDTASLSRITRISEKTISKMLEFCLTHCQWLECVDIADICDNPAGSCDVVAPPLNIGITGITGITEQNNTDKEAHSLFNYWISLEHLPKHKSFTMDMQSAAKRVLSEHSIADLMLCLDNFSKIMGAEPETYFGQYSHTFEDFFRKGTPQKQSPFKKFLAENNPLEKLKKPTDPGDWRKAANSGN